MFGAAAGAGEEMILAPEGNGTDGLLDSIGVDVDAAVVEEGEPVPAREIVPDRLCDGRQPRVRLRTKASKPTASVGIVTVQLEAGLSQSRRVDAGRAPALTLTDISGWHRQCNN